ncbi:MAG: flagellar filament capping protein FliD [Verrucomicrobiae bacterium]|nr:flagellar filament capping protein FliD [Verrucomicrobiae bacterium]
MSTSVGTIRLSGLSTGLDTDAIIEKLLAVESIPVTHLENDNEILSVKSDAITAIKEALASLQDAAETLADASLYSSSTATSSDTDILTATASTSAAKSTYSIEVASIASATTLTSGKSGSASSLKLANPVSTSSTPDDRTLSESYGSSLTGGYFTINGVQITVDAGADTLEDVLERINSSSAGVTASYDPDTDKITLTGSDAIVAGSVGDTSNFLEKSRLYTSGESTVTSLYTIGTTDTGAVLSDSNINGTFTGNDIIVNGMTISVDPDTDTLQNVLDKITASSAGVYASYDSVADQIVLTSKTTGSYGITVQDADDSNIASTLKLTTSASTQTVGNDATIYINDPYHLNPRKSSDNTLTGEETGITGLTLNVTDTTASGESVTLSVATDTDAIEEAITNFVEQYNSVQNMISSYTATPTEDTDSASILASDSTISSLANTLRRTITSAMGSGTIRMLEDLGISTSGDDNLLTIDTSELEDALSTNLDEVISLFSDSSTGIMNSLDEYINSQIDSTTGALSLRLESISDEEDRNNDKIDFLNEQIDIQEERLVSAFAALEEYQSTASSTLSIIESLSSSSSS